MKPRLALLLFVAASMQGLCSSALADPPAVCDASSAWLTQHDPLPTAAPPKHAPNLLDADCPFYQDAWQRFLLVAQPDKNHNNAPIFLTYPAIRDVFTPPAPAMQNIDQNLALLDAGINQAKSQGILVDQNGNPVFYAINVNGTFKDFVIGSGLSTVAALQSVNVAGGKADIQLPPGIIELKSSWQIVPDSNAASTYITAKVQVPYLKAINGSVVPTPQTRTVTVALLQLHVVFSLDDHPELIWTTFEHIDSHGNPDNAPSAKANPPSDDLVDLSDSYPLYQKGLKPKDTYVDVTAKPLPDYASLFREATQSFVSNGKPFATSIYRLYPGSSSTSADVDGDVSAVNTSMKAVFGTSDKRRFYQLIGGMWLDDPKSSNAAKSFGPGKDFTNPPGQSTDNLLSPIAGEDRLSGTAGESFTQPGDGSQYPYCFSCHNTRLIKSDTRSFAKSCQLMPSTSLNVSHVFSKFIDDVQLPLSATSCPKHP
jgi:hypothetical protein